MWDKLRPDILLYVKDGNIWVSPNTGKALTRCPWLRQIPQQTKYTCDIYAHRPDDCKYYPVTIEQMIDDECEMFEAHDLAYPKRAQETLDRLMANSRPPYE